MNTSFTRSARSLIAALATATLATALLAFADPAHASPWTSVGSGGVPDDDSVVFADPAVPGSPTFTARMSLPVVSVSPAVLPRTAKLRYNVVDVFDRKGWAGPIRLGARFVDNGVDARVVLRLYRHEFATGAMSLLLTLDSNAFAPSAAAQSQWTAGCSPVLDFNKNAYWVEADLTRTSAAGAPALHQLRIEDQVRC